VRLSQKEAEEEAAALRKDAEGIHFGIAGKASMDVLDPLSIGLGLGVTVRRKSLMGYLGASVPDIAGFDLGNAAIEVGFGYEF